MEEMKINGQNGKRIKNQFRRDLSIGIQRIGTKAGYLLSQKLNSKRNRALLLKKKQRGT